MENLFLVKLLPHILNMSLTGSAVICVVILARLLLKRAPRWCSYALWAVVLFRLLCPVSVSSVVSLFNVAGAPASAVVPAGPVTVMDYVPSPILVNTPELSPAPAAPVIDAAGPVSGEAVTGGALIADPLTLMALAWGVAAAALLLYGLVSYLSLRVRLWDSERAEGRVYVSKRIQTAFVAGIILPKIYLPAGLGERERECVLAHESCHIRRGDHIIKPLAFIALSLHWFNPLAWFAWVLAMRDMESSCDEAAIKRLVGASRADYAQTLLNLATGRAGGIGGALAFGDDVKRRIKGVAKMKIQKKYVSVLAAVLALAVIAGCAVNPSPAETPAVTPSPEATPMGQCSTAEECLIALPGLDSIELAAAGGETISANVTERRVSDLEKVCEISGLDENGVIEGWIYKSWCRLDVPLDDVMLAGAMERDGDWLCVDGPLAAYMLRRPDGSYDPGGGMVLNDKPVAYNGNYYELVWDAYCSARGMEPLYLLDWTGVLGAQELGTVSAHRFDGDGWYVYVPQGLWKYDGNPLSSHMNWLFSSAYGTGSNVLIELLDGPSEYSERTVVSESGDAYVIEVPAGERRFLITASYDSAGEAYCELAASREIARSFRLWDGTESGAEPDYPTADEFQYAENAALHDCVYAWASENLPGVNSVSGPELVSSYGSQGPGNGVTLETWSYLAGDEPRAVIVLNDGGRYDIIHEDSADALTARYGSLEEAGPGWWAESGLEYAVDLPELWWTVPDTPLPLSVHAVRQTVGGVWSAPLPAKGWLLNEADEGVWRLEAASGSGAYFEIRFMDAGEYEAWYNEFTDGGSSTPVNGGVYATGDGFLSHTWYSREDSEPHGVVMTLSWPNDAAAEGATLLRVLKSVKLL